MIKSIEKYSKEAFVGTSKYVIGLKSIIATICKNTACVLVMGEKGTGKSFFARVVHLEGGNQPKDFLEINSNLFINRAEVLFNKINNFIKDADQTSSEINTSKTIYISNIEKLTREEQDFFYELLKKLNEMNLKVRFIFSSTKNLEGILDEIGFSKDLYFLISTIPVNLLPLRQHTEDLIALAEYFLRFYNLKGTNSIKGFSEEAIKQLYNYCWPGNVAELKNAIERAFLLGKGDYIQSQDLILKLNVQTENILSSNISLLEDGKENKIEDKTLKAALDVFKKNYVTKILEENNWNQTKAAKVLGIQRTYVIRLINELDIRKK
ncbi:MAG: sigma 54-interacting transcriptional regulator [Treponema sp.]|nr:sigma 54-interacting transcriptional regulator [Treponema sp.]